ncbi:MFS transporter [Actinomadura sp. HBU206391]|uniref:MFS transporter n=1 Tax=Actinomadura sp. HBU206391 TaxID=2731692 RepID=UPI00164FBDD3|nr:MFS transporter [Actinomadura sp. HBU206391]MBC6460315.1 MFS transporter [Actinomadura sp. HBU206391]
MPRNKPIALLSVSHACVDVYQGAVPALVPFLVAERAYGYAAASGIVLAASLLSSLVQPLFGVLTDRWAMPWLLPVSTVVAGAGIALSGVSDSYPLTFAAVALSGVGVAAYHPESARTARAASRGGHAAMSWFSLGGNLGFAAAPLMVTAIIAAGGLTASPALVVPAVLGSLLCVFALRAQRSPSAGPAQAAPAPGAGDRAAFLRLSLAVICRSVVFVGLSSFIALYAQQRTGGDATAGGAALFVLFIGGAVGTVLGGRLAAHWGRVRCVRWAYAATIPAVTGVVFVPGPAFYVFVALTSAALYIPFSLQITLGQDYLPTRVGTASGVTLGLTISIGGLAAPLIGVVADATSLRSALTPLIALPALAWLISRTLLEPALPDPAGRYGVMARR